MQIEMLSSGNLKIKNPPFENPFNNWIKFRLNFWFFVSLFVFQIRNELQLTSFFFSFATAFEKVIEKSLVRSRAV